ncbi:MAG: hypothetical protein ACRDWI_09420 [Jiangellaceae bacterium]
MDEVGVSAVTVTMSPDRSSGFRLGEPQPPVPAVPVQDDPPAPGGGQRLLVGDAGAVQLKPAVIR